METLHDKKIAFPEAKALSDLFSNVQSREPGKACPDVLVLTDWEGTKNSFRVSGSLSVHDHDGCYRWFKAVPSAAVLDYIRNHVLHCKYDTMTFQVIVWDDGRALVTAQHGQIIGSHYLAIIDAATIPTGE